MSDFKIVINEAKCDYCFICVDSCPGDALEIKGLYIPPFWNSNKCIGCSICAFKCPKEAIEVSEDG